MRPFDGNDYRKRVLAGIAARGGVQTSDPFEYYDLPLAELRDTEVVAQVDTVWAFWQKQRDSPKYRGLILALLDAHREMAPRMKDRGARRELAEQVARFRADRDTDRFAELDNAIERLVQRFGGVPSSKLDGLRSFAAGAGLDPAEVEQRLARVPIVQTRSAPAAEAVPAAVRRQLRADLDELGRLLGKAPPVTLYDLLGLPPGAPKADVALAREGAAARNRTFRPDRRRALLDDLLAAVTRLLIEGDPEAYLDAVAEDVTVQLRPRFTAAVLVEDVLTPEDFAHLMGEAEAAGLDAVRADRVLRTLATEAGVPVPTAGSARSGASPAAAPRPPATGRSRGAEGPAGGQGSAAYAELAEARAALRAGRALEAQRLVDQAHRRAGGMLPPIRAVADEVAGVLAEARQQWRAVEQALTARRFHEAAVALDRLVHIAQDVTGADGTTVRVALQQARAGLEAAGARLEQAEALTGPAREAALIAALREFPDAELLVQAVRSLPVHPPEQVRAERTGGGVLVQWMPSATTDVEYRVQRIAADGSRRTLGSTRATRLEDGDVPASGVPTYVVVARRAGVLSAEVASDPGGGELPAAAPSAPRSRPVAPAAARPLPVHKLVASPLGRRRVRLAFDAPASGTCEVRRLPAGTRPPAPGALVADVDALGEPAVDVGPGVAVDSRSPGVATYVAVSRDHGTGVAGASVTVVDLPPVTRLRVEDDRVRWDWPAGCTEVMLVWRDDAPPEGADDPLAQRRKVTNTRYDIDSGAALPAHRPVHVAAFTCTRDASGLVTSFDAPPEARLSLDQQPGLDAERRGIAG